MEYQIKRISNKEIDILAKEKEFPVNSINSLGIIIPYSYLKELVSLNWYDILFAVENGFLLLQSVIECAVKKIENNEDYTCEVLELACITKDELSECRDLIYCDLKKLANQVLDVYKKETKAKILYVLLSWVFDHRELYEDPLNIVEFIYDDFGFPESISSFVRYRPVNESALNLNNLGVEHLFENWKDYLNKEKIKYLKQEE